MSRETYGTTFDISAGGETTETVLEVPPGEAILLDRCVMSTETGNIGPVTLQLFSGDKPLAPQNNPISPAIDKLELTLDDEVSPGDTVTVRASNTSDSAIGATVLVEGVRQDDLEE
jgi:hypothetical protein